MRTDVHCPGIQIYWGKSNHQSIVLSTTLLQSFYMNLDVSLQQVFENPLFGESPKIHQFLWLQASLTAVKFHKKKHVNNYYNPPHISLVVSLKGSKRKGVLGSLKVWLFHIVDFHLTPSNQHISKQSNNQIYKTNMTLLVFKDFLWFIKFHETLSILNSEPICICICQLQIKHAKGCWNPCESAWTFCI